MHEFRICKNPKERKRKEATSGRLNLCFHHVNLDSLDVSSFVLWRYLPATIPNPRMKSFASLSHCQSSAKRAVRINSFHDFASQHTPSRDRNSWWSTNRHCPCRRNWSFDGNLPDYELHLPYLTRHCEARLLQWNHCHLCRTRTTDYKPKPNTCKRQEV